MLGKKKSSYLRVYDTCTHQAMHVSPMDFFRPEIVDVLAVLQRHINHQLFPVYGNTDELFDCAHTSVPLVPRTCILKLWRDIVDMYVLGQRSTTIASTATAIGSLILLHGTSGIMILELLASCRLRIT